MKIAELSSQEAYYISLNFLNVYLQILTNVPLHLVHMAFVRTE